MKNKMFVTVFITSLMLISAILGGCSQADSPPAESADTAESSTVEAPDEVYTIGAIVPTLDAQFWNRYVEFMQQGADELGVELIVLNADNNADQMSKFIEDLVARDVDGIIHVPYWATGIKALNEAANADTPVIMADVYLDDINPQDADYSNYLAFVGPSDEEAGYQMAKTLFAAMEPNADGKKVIGVVDGTPGTSVAIDRHAGLERALTEHPEVVVAGTVTGNFVRDESQTAFESLYQGNPDIKGAWAANGGTATGVMTAIKNAGKVPGEDILVVAMDLNPENVDAIKSGELLFDIGGHWLQGGFALVMMYDYLNGFDLPADQANVKLDLLPLTADLIPQFESDFPNGVPAYDFREHSRVYSPDAPPATFELKYNEEAESSAAEAPDEVYTIGAIVPTLDAQFWNRYVEFMQQGADELGVELIVLNADNNADQMSKFLEDLVARDVDGIIHVPYWATGIKALNEAANADIPVIMADVYLGDINPQDADYPNYLAFVGPSDEEAGYQMAKTLFAGMKPNADGKKVIGVVDGTPGTSVAIDRHAGLERALAEHPEVIVAGTVTGNFVRDESQTAFESLYQGNPDIEGVWAANGGTATGVMTAIKNADKVPGKDILVVAMDLNPENVDAIKAGELLFDIGGHWLQGGFALVMMYDHLNGFDLPADQANVKLDLLPLTADLIPQFESDFPNGVPAYDFREHSRVYTPDAPPATFELKYNE